MADNEDKYALAGSIAEPYLSSATLAVRKITTTNCRLIGNTGGAVPGKMLAKGVTATNNQQNQKVLPRIGFYRYTASLPHIARANTANNLNLRNWAASGQYRLLIFAAEETFWQNTFEASFKINLRKLSLSGFDIKSKVHIHGWNYLIKRIVMDCNNPENSLLEAYRA